MGRCTDSGKRCGITFSQVQDFAIHSDLRCLCLHYTPSNAENHLFAGKGFGLEQSISVLYEIT